MGSIGLIGFQSYLKYGFRDRVNKVYMLNITPYILEERYEALELDKHDRMIINDYIACMNSSMCRANDISYFAGVRDTLSFLIQAGLLKQSEK